MGTEFLTGQLDSLSTLILAHPEPTIVHRGQLIPACDYNLSRKLYRSGSQVLDKLTGLEITEYEWSTNELHNRAVALARLLGGRQ